MISFQKREVKYNIPNLKAKTSLCFFGKSRKISASSEPLVSVTGHPRRTQMNTNPVGGDFCSPLRLPFVVSLPSA